MDDRLSDLEQLAEALKPVVLASHSDHGLQGLSGLVGQYRATLKEIEEIRAQRPAAKGTVLDELAKRRADPKPSARTPRTSSRNQ